MPRSSSSTRTAPVGAYPPEAKRGPHASRFDTTPNIAYSEPVFDQHNILRVKPASAPLQRVRNFRLTLEPAARTRSHLDYFGTEAIEWGVPGEHERLAITAEADVTTEAPGEPPAGGWEAVRPPRYTDAGGEFPCWPPATSLRTASSGS